MALYSSEISLLLETARDAGSLLMKYFGQAIEITEKGPLDLVTEADWAVEKLVRSRIAAQFPGDAVLGEESGAQGSSSRLWTTDPLDGTVNFAHRIPLFAVCIAFAEAGEVQAGVVYNPFSRECYTAVRGQGAFLNGLPIRCAQATRPGDADIYLNSHGLRYEESAPRLLQLFHCLGTRVQGLLNPGSMSLGVCWVASGRLDAVVSMDMDVYSTPASSLIMSEAGVVVTDLQGVPYGPSSASLLAANPTLHSELQAILRDEG